MEELKNILNKIVKDYGLKILEDPQKFKAVFADYTKGEYIAEKELFTKLIETGAVKEISNAEEIQIVKNGLVKKMYDRYFIDEKTCSNYIDIFISILRNDYIPLKETEQTENHKIVNIENEEYKKTNELPIEINNYQKQKSNEKFLIAYIFSVIFFVGFILISLSFIDKLIHNNYFSLSLFIIAITLLIQGILFLRSTKI